MDTDRNLLFGVLALQIDLITPDQLVEACSLWVTRRQTSLADVLVERGWLTAAGRADLERLLQSRLTEHQGNVQVSLAEAADQEVRRALAVLSDSAIQCSLAELPPDDQAGISTLHPLAESRERYRLTRLHARGGLGRVWLARDAALGRDVALKELLPERDDSPELRARFLVEAQITGQLEHPAIVPVHEVGGGAEGRPPFYTMRFVRGRTLTAASRDYHARRRTGQAGPLDLRELLGAFVTVCQAVAYANARGVIHRDLKGPNVLLGDFGEVVVLDWGLAKLTGQAEPDAAAPPVSVVGLAADATLQGQVLGTPGYMAPEQATGRLDLIDARTDVYGLGAILYEVLTGQAPFAGADLLELLARVQTAVPTPPRQVWPEAPRALEAVCLRALAKRQEDRYPSAQELGLEVQRWLADEPVAAYREPAAARLSRWARRHKPAVAGAAALLLAAAASLGVIAVLTDRSRRQLIAEQAQTETARQAAAANAERAEQNLETTRRAVREHFLVLSDVKLGPDTGLHAERKKLLEEARRYFEDILVQHPDDPRFRADVAEAQFRVAHIHAEIGDKDQARQAYERARDLYARLVREHPEVPDYQASQATTLNNLGLAYQDAGRVQEAERAYHEALTVHHDLAQRSGNNPQLQARVADVYSNLGVLYSSTGRADQAERVYRDALAIEQGLADRAPDDLQGQEALAATHYNLGGLYADTNRPKEAETAFRQALEIRKTLVNRDPTDPQHQFECAETYNRLGMLYRATGRLPEAEQAYREALARQQQLADRHPARTDYQDQLAGTYNNLGVLYGATHRLKEAEQAHRQALAVWRSLAQKHPGVPALQASAAKAHVNLGALYQAASRLPEAEQAYRDALAALGDLAARYPSVTVYRFTQATVFYNLGVVYKLTGRLPEAEQAYREALALRQELAQREPTVARYRADLAQSHTSLGLLYNAAGRHADALREWDLALELTDEADRLPLRLQRAKTLARLNHPAQAVAEANALMQAKDTDADTLVEAACVYALAAAARVDDRLGAQDAARAVALLRQAVDSGFKDVDRLRQEKELDSLRSRRDFQKLLTQLPAGPAPLAK